MLPARAIVPNGLANGRALDVARRKPPSVMRAPGRWLTASWR